MNRSENSSPRRNPVLRARVPTQPPQARSRIAMGLSAAASQGHFRLQRCGECKAVQYPPTEICKQCLSSDLSWQEQDRRGTLLATTVVRRPYENYFKERGHWRTGMVRLQAGVNVIAFLLDCCPDAEASVQLMTRLDRAGRAVFIAGPATGHEHEWKDDPIMREFGNAPAGRKVLITDCSSPVGIALAKAVLAAGATTVWAGVAERWKSHPTLDELDALEQVTIVPLDVTNGESVQTLASQIGGRVDILINSAEFHRPHTIMSRRGVETARAEMETNYFGLLRLSQEFIPAMGSRGAEGPNNAVAWVNLLSIYSLSNYPTHGTFSSSKAAAYSHSQAMRAECKATGIRVVNVFPGPIDDEWNQLEQPPKIAPDRLARAVVDGLQRGLEDVFPDPIAKDWHQRWLDDPKVLEMEQSL